MKIYPSTWLRRPFAWAALLLLALPGCFVPSLYGLYTAETAVQPEGLVGNWRPLKTKEKWEFNATEGKKFSLVLRPKGQDPVSFSACVVRIGNNLFLDMLPDNISPLQVPQEGSLPNNNNDFVRWNLFPVHTFSRLRLRGDTLALATFFPSYLDTLQIKSGERFLPTVHTEGGLLITATTPELHKYLARYGDNNDLFKEEMLLVRDNKKFLKIF